MSLKPSHMTSMQFLTITVDLIIKFRVDPSSRHRFLTFLSKIVIKPYFQLLGVIKNEFSIYFCIEQTQTYWIIKYEDNV